MSRWWDEAKGFYRPENSNVRGNLIFTNSYRSKSFDFLQKLFIHFFNSVILHIFFWRQVFFAKILQLGGSGMKWKLCRVVFTAASILSPPCSPIFLSKLITRTRNCLPRDFERRKLLMIWKKSSSTRNMKDITKVLHFKKVLDIDKVLYITKMWATLPERRRLTPNYTRQ